MLENIFSIWTSIISLSTPLWLMGLGLLLCQRAGLLQWGIEGIVLSVVTVTEYAMHAGLYQGNDGGHGFLLSLFAAMVLAVALGMLYFLLSEIMKVNQIWAGILIFFLGVAIRTTVAPQNSELKLQSTDLPFALEYVLPYLVILFLLAASFFLYKTKLGMVLRGIGDEPAVLVQLYHIRRWQFLINFLGMVLIGCASLLLTIIVNSTAMQPLLAHDIISENSLKLEGFGWLVLLLVAVSAWSPHRLLLSGFVLVAAFLYAGLSVGMLYGLFLLLFIFLLARRDFFENHAPINWQKFFMPK